MALSLLPASAFAAELVDSGAPALQTAQQEDVASLMGVSPQSTYEATIKDMNGNKIKDYPKLSNALFNAAFSPNCTVELLQNVTCDGASVYGGSFTLDCAGFTVSGENMWDTTLTFSGTVQIKGGSFTSVHVSLTENAKITSGSFARVSVTDNAKLAGGSYELLHRPDSRSWTDFLPTSDYAICSTATGEKLNEDQLYNGGRPQLRNVTVKNFGSGTETTYVAQVGDDQYTTLAAAITDADPDNIIKLLTTVTESVEINKAVTLDLNGFGINGTVTFTDSGARLANTAPIGISGSITELTINAGGKTLIDVLAYNLAFRNATTATDVNGAVPTLRNVQLINHICGIDPRTNTCPCGRKGSSCDHSNINADTGKCTECNKQFIASMTYNGTTKWYDEQDGLQTVLNAVTQDGSTVKLFQSVAVAFVTTPQATSFTIDWNGHTLTGLLSVTVGGSNTITLTDTSGTNQGGVNGEIEDSAVHLKFEAGRYSSIPYVNPGFKTQLDRLADGCAFVDANNNRNVFNANRKAALSNVQVIPHTCSAANLDGTCACGRHFDTTPPVITLDDSNICGQGTESNMQYVEVKGNKLYFTVADAETGIKSVFYNGTTLTPENGKYSIVIDDTTGKTTARIVATNNAEQSSALNLVAYRMVETKISQVWNGAEVVEICGESVTTDHPVDEIRWIRATKPYSVKIKADPSRINANTILELRPYTKAEGSYCAIRSSSSDSANYTYYFTTASRSLAQYSQDQSPSFTLNDLKDIRIVRTKDTVAPTATITVRDVAYNSFSEIYYVSGTSGMIPVYDLFYKGPVTVDVTATDDNSGVQKAEYLFNDNPCQTAKQVNEISSGWQPLQLDSNGKAQFSLAANQKGYLYVRVTDEDGNVKIVNVSKGLVIYTDLQVTSADPTITLSLDEARRSDARTLPVNSGGSKNKVTIKCKDESGNDITMNPVFDAYPHNEYTVDSDGNIVLTAAFLRSRAVGTYTLTITIDPMEEEYKDIAGNDKPTTVTVTLNVTKIKPTFTADNIPLSDKDFDGSAVNHPTIAPSITGGRNVRYEYKVKDADDNTYTTTPPTTAGDYVVKVTIESDESYEAVTATKNFTISPKEVTITGTTVSNKVYNGNTDAVIANLGTLNGIVDSHNNVTIKAGSATFNNKNVGENKTVTFSGFTLEGADAKNYTLTAQPANATASITPRLVTITGLAVDNKTYDGKPDATISADLTLTLAPVANNADSGIVPNDDVTLNPTAAKAEFENKNAGADKPVTFSDFALTGADAGNYTLVLPTDVTATIERKTLTVDGLKIADKTYDGTKTAQWDGTPTLIGLVEGETLQLICGVPTFTSAIPGSNIPVTFTPFSLADGTGLAANYTLIQPVSGSITGNIVVNRHNHSRGPRPYLPQQPANGANGTNGGKDGVTSARTGDMGVALYAALSLASLSGTALLTRKRKETL